MLAGACGGSPKPKAVVAARAENFRVLYRVVHSEVAGKPTISWEVLTVERPFVASDLTYAKKPDLDALGEPQTGTMADAEHLYSIDGARMRLVAGRQPGLPTGDQALLNVASEAQTRGLAKITGHATVNDASCTTVRFVEPPVGALAPLTDDDDNHDDMCLSPGGVILREAWTLKGRVVLTREAVEMRPAPDDAFDTSGAEDVTAGVPTPRVAAMEEGLTPPPTPSGYDAASNVDFFLPRSDAPSQLAYASKVWAFGKGGDEITVELGAGQVVPWSQDQDKPLRVGPRDAASLVRSDGIEIHWTNADHWVRVRGSVSLLKLFPYARLVNNWDSSPADVPK